MTQPNYEEREVWIIGRYKCTVCAIATIYPKSIVATAEIERVTVHQMKNALSREFPRHNFYLNADGRGYLRADAARFPGDGV